MSSAIYGPMPDPYPPIQNKYYKWYINIINTAKNRGNKRKNINYYVQCHHIIPKSFYIKNGGWLVGDPNTKINLVFLTLREHFLIHWLLTKCYTNLAKAKMIMAFHRMCNGNKNSIYYEIACKLASTIERKSINNPHWKGGTPIGKVVKPSNIV